jgi:hypothetical protein
MTNDIAVKVDKGIEPVYIWETGKSIYVSKKQRVVAEAWVRTRNLKECERALKAEGWDYSWKTCGRWLRIKEVEEWVMQRMEECGVYAGWTRERWYKVMTDHIQGKKRLRDGDMYAMNLIAKYKGWETPVGGGVINNISIVQANGER